MGDGGFNALGFFWGMGAREHVTSKSRLLIYDAVELMVVCSHDVRAQATQDKKLSAWGSGFSGRKHCL